LNKDENAAKIEFVGKWIAKADNDLTIAKDERFLKNENHVTDGICFHCQQAVEKYLKAYLTLKDIDIGKTHNLEILAMHCSKIDTGFNELNFGNLSQYGVAIRYPDDFYMPTLAEADNAIQIAEQVRKFAVGKIEACIKK
jgi:HEPN domain-containing protein